LRTTRRSSRTRCLVAALCVGLAAGCYSPPKTTPIELLALTPESAANKAIQTRQFETPNSEELLSASAAVLQDLGFQVTEADRDLGFLRAAKERSARERAQEINRGGGIPDWGECTALAVQPARSATRGTLLAQNWDWLGTQREAVVLLRTRETDGSTCLAFTEAGMLAKIGLNGHGLGVCLNLMRSRNDGRRPGVPVHVLLRALLKCERVADAIRLASSVTHGGSSNVLCADREGNAASLELSPSGVELVRPEDGVVCHTNHFLMPAGLRAEAPRAPTLSTEQRLDRIQALVHGRRGAIGVADLQSMLRDETEGVMSICRHPDRQLPREARVETVASVVMELASGVMHVAPDVPSKVPYGAIALADLMTAEA